MKPNEPVAEPAISPGAALRSRAVVESSKLSSLVVHSVTEIPDVKNATLVLSPTPLPLGALPDALCLQGNFFADAECLPTTIVRSFVVLSAMGPF